MTPVSEISLLVLALCGVCRCRQWWQRRADEHHWAEFLRLNREI
ncbi:MAG: hypothetical protein ACYS0D_05250 [Planctomycetota bacterium]|jgi:hypothetical protein